MFSSQYIMVNILDTHTFFQHIRCSIRANNS